MKIGIIYYGLNNIFSICNAVNKIGFIYKIVSKNDDLSQFDGLILPGVGSFPKAMKALKKDELDIKIVNFFKTGKPILAICLGYQMLFEKSLEFSETEGLKILKGEVIKFPKKESQKVPHIGWNKIMINKENKILEKNDFFYFVHSYYPKVIDEKIILAYTKFGNLKFSSAILKNNLLGCQFHPEKSGKIGLNMIKKFFIKNVQKI